MVRIVTFGKCFADPTALRIIRILMQTEATISDLQLILEMDRHTVDLRLTKLREAKISHHKQQGRWLMYGIDPRARPILDQLFTSFYHDVTWNPEFKRDNQRIQMALEAREA